MNPFVRTLAAIALCVIPILAHADEAADRAAIEAAAQRWTRAFNARDIDEMLTLTTADAVLLDSQRSPINGRAAIRDAWHSAMARNDMHLSNMTKEIVVTDDVAWRIAMLKVTAPHRAATSALEVWKRVNGTWKLHRQMSAGLLTREPLVRPRPSEPRLDDSKP